MYTNGTVSGGAAGPEQLRGVQVSANFFRALGVAPALGRDFRDEEQQAGRNRVDTNDWSEPARYVASGSFETGSFSRLRQRYQDATDR